MNIKFTKTEKSELKYGAYRRIRVKRYKMRVYYYTAEQFALSNVINERIKISMLDELNDPF